VPSDFFRPAEREAFSLYWCTPCAYGLVWPRPGPSEVARFYDLDGYYTHSADDQRDPGAPRPDLVDRLRLHLAWRVDRGLPMPDSVNRALGHRPLSVCDIGCGNGWLLEELRKSGHDVVGVELDPLARETATRRGLRVLAGSAESLPELPAAGFDAVVMSHVLEHTIDPLQAIANAARLLKAGGRLIVEVPNNACASLSDSGVAWPWLDVPRHLNFFTGRSLRGIARAANLDLLGFEWTGYCRMFSEEWIGEERARWDRFAPSLNGSMPPRASKARAWSLLARTAFSPPGRKYDSVRMVARSIA
jgi:SAM-dependent methyltransferase